jgi:hypothetical protein
MNLDLRRPGNRVGPEFFMMLRSLLVVIFIIIIIVDARQSIESRQRNLIQQSMVLRRLPLLWTIVPHLIPIVLPTVIVVTVVVTVVVTGRWNRRILIGKLVQGQLKQDGRRSLVVVPIDVLDRFLKPLVTDLSILLLGSTIVPTVVSKEFPT